MGDSGVFADGNGLANVTAMKSAGLSCWRCVDSRPDRWERAGGSGEPEWATTDLNLKSRPAASPSLQIVSNRTSAVIA